MKIFAFDGPDGSGKTPCLAVVADALANQGMLVHICAPYRAIEVYHLWATNPMRAACEVRRIIDINLEVALKDKRDVVLFDRHWPTAAVSTTNWQAVELIQAAPLDHLFLLVTSEPKPKLKDSSEPWMAKGFDHHWIAYRCLAEDTMAHRPSQIDGCFNLKEIAKTVSALLGL